MGGGLLQLVAYGAQDVYLTGNPQITFFKVVYRRHTNFAIESIMQTHNGTPQYGSSITCTISRNGDLINRAYVEVELYGTGYDKTAAKDAYVNYIGLKLLKSVTVEIGGQQIDKHYSDWMFIWNELSLPTGKRYGYNKMIGADSWSLSKLAETDSFKLYIPLEFWFCRNVGLSLPLIALQYHEVKFRIEFAEKSECAVNWAAETAADEGDEAPTAAAVTIKDIKRVDIWVDYIYLDTDERRKFAQLSHEYLIEQLQFGGEESYSTQVRLNFNHPCKELVWVSKWPTAAAPATKNQTVNWYNYSKTDAMRTSDSAAAALVDGGNPFVTAHIKLNGNDRIAPRDGTYFDVIQPYQHHTNVPRNNGINVYSFAIKPEEHQPSGTLNMSRIDSAVLALKIDDATKSTAPLHVYAVNYNVLRILSGMGGLAYSN
tara:strand:- start:114 stop:1400 length:1287 start_codon:yes stop_codon:yes gene_type:complete